jgi:glycosyltransferase involved in cell wall biosynthesis
MTTARLLPMSAIVPTRDRSQSLSRMLESLAGQASQPAEIIIVDASSSTESEEICAHAGRTDCASSINYIRAARTGAAVQREQAMTHASTDAILFVDDDVVFELECIDRLWAALQSDSRLGGVSSMIVNQRYHSPGLPSRLLFRLLHGRSEESFAGKCIGPALNILPEDRPDLPDVVPVEWLNTTCTLYRKAALPTPLFADHFKGYSLMEDVALSLAVGRQWRLANARTARIIHESQPGEHKDEKAVLARMQLVNRHYVMTRVLARDRLGDYLKLLLLESFNLVTGLKSSADWISLPQTIRGKLRAIAEIASSERGLGSESLSRYNHA